MRAGVCWSAVALLVLVTATSALRTFQVENLRNSRRLSNFDNSGSTSTTNIDEVQPTFRPRNHRRREEPSPSTPRDVTRKRSRNKLSDTHISSTVIELSQVENERNERFDSRRTNRIRSRPIENESSATSFASRESSSNNKVRQSNRRPQYVTTQAPLEYSSSYSNDNRVRDVSLRKNKIISSETSSTLSSPISEASTKDINIKRTQPTQTQSYQAINDNKTEVIAPDFYDFSRTVPKEEAISTSQFKRRSSTARITESVTITTPKSTRRGRVNTRTNLKLEDMASSGATNTLTISEKKPTVETKEDTRNSRKLRYRTRFSEIDTNITGEGLTTSNEEVNHKKRKNSSQAEIRTSSSASAENKIQGNTEGYPSKSVTNKVMRVVRRPYSKEKESLVTVPKVKTSEEIGDDDNYPETFKALIQAKNASTQESSPPSESLSVKASHKAINTITQPSQLSNVSRDSNNTTLLRSKLNRKENESNIGTSENNKIEFATDSPTSKSQEYRLRGSHSSKSRKLNPLNASFVTKSSITSAVTEKPLYKFTRKLKTTTEVSSFANTTKSKTYQNSQPLQDSMTRTSYYSRKTFGKHSIRSTESTTTKENLKTLTSSGKVNNTVKLPRTSYYSRLRNKNSIVSTTDFAINETPIAEKKTENTAEMPLIFTLLNKSGKTTLNNNSSSEKPEEHVEPFLIKVSSKESHENNTENEIINKAEESENVPIMNLATTQKYHANFKERSLSETEKKIYNVPAATPPIRNIQTRKYARKIIKPKGKIETTSKDRTSRKYSDAFSKTTEASTNGIMSETEKPKSKFSSKYRAQYIDKPFYKPTVPTVTPTTAWRKYDETDRLLIKSIEEPKWFEGDDWNESTPELMSRQNVVGEEIDLGPDMNAISFTQTRNAISSADLRLSESVAKPSHIMNVEASNHSPSVTVSIFDALAEILTSTPRIQISTTTEVPKQFFTDSVTKQTLNGVSNNNNVNSDTDASSQSTNTASTISISTITPVQITDQTTPIVLNRLPVVENILPSLKTDGVKLSSASTPPITFTPSPTTPISVRRPFAIKVLYSDTERLTDNPTSSELSTNWSTTDNPEMVYNTVSDLLLSNNKLVSSELTSMLSNNIQDIIKNLDEDSRSRLSVDMEKLLKTLIPRAMIKLPTLNNNIPDTTPYSLEEIKDTANIDINKIENTAAETNNLLQTIRNNNVNIMENSTKSSLITESTEQIVNSSGNPQSIISSTFSEFESETTVSDTEITTEAINISTLSSLDLPTTTLTLIASDTKTAVSATLSGLEIGTTVVDNVETFDNSSPDFANNPLPLPLFTNLRTYEFNSSDVGNLSSLVTQSDTQSQDIDNINVEDPSQLTRLQLWVLSKKARVLKMIEQLIRDHNDEIAKELINQPKRDSLSSRLSEIIYTMNSTTESIDNNIDMTTPYSTTSSLFESLISTTQFERSDSITTETVKNILSLDDIDSITTIANDVLPNTTPLPTLQASTTDADTSETLASQTTSEIADALYSTTAKAAEQTTFLEESTNTQELQDFKITSTENSQTTTQADIETPSSLFDIKKNSDNGYTTENNLATTTQSGIETTTVILVNETKSNDAITTKALLNVVTTSTIPKKDYVIFGILPNNTVVRKDPNDNVLETLTEASPYIIYGVLPNNTVIRKFPNGTRVPRIMQKIDILPISPWSLRNPYSPIHNNPAIVRPQSNPIRVSTNIVTSTDTNNGMENRLTTDTVNNQQMMISSSALILKDSSSLGITTATIKPSAEKSTASHVLSLRTTTMLPSIHEILLNSLSSATKEEMVISSMTSSTREPRILTLDIDPETKQIRTEKPGDGEGNTVFKFIPIDEVTVPPQNTNVLKIVSTKIPKINSEKEVQIVMAKSVTEVNLSVPQMQTNLNESNPTISRAIASTTYETVTNIMNDQSSPRVTIIDTPIESKSENVASTTSFPSTAEKSIQSMTTEKDETFVQPSMHTIITPEFTPTELPKISATSSSVVSSTLEPATTSITTPSFELSNQDVIGENVATISPMQLSEKTVPSTTNTSPIASKVQNDIRKAQEESVLLHSLLEVLSTTIKPISSQKNDEIKLLQSLLLTTSQKLPPTNQLTNLNKATTMRSIEEELKQFKKDTELLKVLLQATGQNPAALNIPGIGDIKLITTSPTTKRPITTTASTTTTIKTTPVPTITTTAKTTSSITDEIRKLKEDTQLLQALLQATGQNVAELNLPKISGITSNVRIASNPLTTSYESPNTPTTNYQPVYTTIRTKQILTPQTEIPQTTTSVITNLQEQKSTVTADIGISTTFLPVDRSLSTTTNPYEPISTLSNKRASGIGQITTERPSTSTFSVEEDLEFLKNLKTVLNTNTNTDDPEAALANRVIALAVERSLNEIQTEKQADSSRAGKNINPDFENSIRITTPKTTTTTKISTTTFKPTEASTQITPSIEDDIKQFEEDTKLLQALIKATGQDPSKFNIPTLPTINKPGVIQSSPTTAKPSGIKIAVKDNLKSVQDDAQLLQTLIKLKDAQETTTQKNKLAITGQSPDEALQKLIQKAKPTVMASEATKSSISLSTEYGNSNDALLAALLKEQGFGPTTASSIDEQARLAALLNQVVVTPKARRTTTLPPPPPAPRRPILDGIAWLWQQWRDTAPGANSDTTRTNHRQPATPTRQSAAPSAAASSGVNWFGSGPFVGNADERPSSNRIPLEPPRAVVAEQAPGRGQLVSAAINVTRAFSQFLGAAIQGAAQTVQNVIRAGQKLQRMSTQPDRDKAAITPWT